MPSLSKQPMRPIGREAPSKRNARAAASVDEMRRAAARQSVASFVAALPGSLEDKRRAIATAMKLPYSPLSLLSHVTPKTTLWRLNAKWKAGATSVEAFRDKPRGRPRTRLDDHLEEATRLFTISGKYPHPVVIHALVCEEAKAMGLDEPSYKQIFKRVARIGVGRRSAAHHGRRAARIDGMPASTLPFLNTHDACEVDEAEDILWLKTYEQKERRLVSMMSTLVLQVDWASGVITGWTLVDPSQREDPDRAGYRMRAGYASDDVWGCIVRSACKELASPACKPFAGYRSTRLRMDNHPTHNAILPRLIKAGYEVADMESYFPPARGGVESCVKIAKRLLSGVVGDKDDYIPADQPAATPEETRRTIITTDRREPRKERVPVDNLMTHQEACYVIDEAVERYNHEMISGSRGVTRAKAYFDQFPHGATSGTAVLAALDCKNVLVQKPGIVIQKDKRKYRFAWETDNTMLLMGSTWNARVDPLMRGIWLDYEGRWKFFPALKAWAALKSAGIVARAKKQAAAAWSEDARSARAALNARDGVDAIPSPPFGGAPEHVDMAEDDEFADMDDEPTPFASKRSVASGRTMDLDSVYAAASDDAADHKGGGQPAVPQMTVTASDGSTITLLPPASVERPVGKAPPLQRRERHKPSGEDAETAPVFTLHDRSAPHTPTSLLSTTTPEASAPSPSSLDNPHDHD